MNSKQKVVILAALIIGVAIGLRPPWIEKLNRPGSGSDIGLIRIRPMGCASLYSPPSLTQGQRLSSVEVDLQRLIIQESLVIGAAVGLSLVFWKRRKA